MSLEIFWIYYLRVARTVLIGAVDPKIAGMSVLQYCPTGDVEQWVHLGNDVSEAHVQIFTMVTMETIQLTLAIVL